MRGIWRRKVARFLVLFLTVSALLIWKPGLVFYPAGQILYRNDHPKPGADLILVLMGSPEIRPPAGALAVQSGFAPALLMFTPQLSPLEEAGFIPSEEKIALETIRRTGLTTEKVIVSDQFGRATSTIDEAIALKKWLSGSSRAIQRIIVVTSWPHSSRAGWALETVLGPGGPKIELMPVDSIPFTVSDWWQSEPGMLFVFEEYIKYARYLIKYLGRTP